MTGTNQKERNELMKEDCQVTFICPVEATVKLMGGKYKPVILWNLIYGPMRYSEIHRLAPNATDKVLSQQLKELESDGLINKKIYPEVPPRTEYTLTDFGKSLFPVLNAMCDWGKEYIKENNLSYGCSV